MEDIRISVVMPCYNAETTIEKSIKSILNQSYLPLEIIIVDDGSKDNCKSIIQDMQKISVVPIKYFFQVNSGPSVARNLGVSFSEGDWIAFLDSDDAWIPNKIEMQIELLRQYPNGRLFGTYRGSESSCTLKGHTFQVAFTKLCFRCLFTTSAVLVRKDSFNEFKFNESQRYSEDYRLWLDICFKYIGYVSDSRTTYSLLNKKAFGESGLSSNLWNMEKGELSNFKYLFSSNKISFLSYSIIVTYSLIKYSRRVSLTFFHSLFKL